MNKPEQLEDLRALYRAGFQAWASQVGYLDQIQKSVPESGVLQDAQCRTIAAEAGYREVRNRLAEEMAVGHSDTGSRNESSLEADGLKS